MAPPLRGGRRRNVRNGDSMRSGSATCDQPCRLFLQGRCKYGDRCRYTHDSSSPVKKGKERASPTAEEVAEKTEYREWKRRLRRDPLAPTIYQMQAIMNDALEILAKKNQSLYQHIPRDLVDQDGDKGTKGLQWIREIMSMRVSQRYSANDFLLVARPFLKLVTHPLLLDCLSVDTYVGDMYVFICGSSGTRAFPFFQHVCTALETQESRNKDAHDILTCLVAATREVIIRNQKALYHDSLPNLIENVAKLCEDCMVDSEPRLIYTKTRVEEIQRLIQRADAKLASKTEEPEIDITGALRGPVRPDYPMLQTPGAHHDNDKADISHIKIIPTEDEIRCEKGELLPSTNFDSPYFLCGGERLIDIHFRLLRHDIFDEARKTIAEILHIHDRKLDLAQWLRTSESNRAIRTYSSASLDRLEFTKQRGLGIDISVMEPPRLARQTNAQKQRWWNDTRRLDEGCLLCLVWFHNGSSSIIFLTVSQKIIAVKQRGSLVPEHGRRATITTSLIPGQASNDLEALVKRQHERNEGQNILIEFPSILFGTFAPILENMQQMYLESRLPFSNWIVPNLQRDTVGGSALDMPPPIYAREPGFSFKMDSILNDKSATLSLGPTNIAPDLHNQLKSLTTLDEGQCDALISALTREFCLIQGPPGTGKSFLGVQLMRVLVANKARAELGPIVVVCYTNHALDQFLEHLIDEGIDKVIRIGSKSSSEALEGKNLRAISRGVDKTGAENYILGSCHSKREEIEKNLQKKFGALQALNRRYWGGFDYHLRTLYPEIHQQFSGKDADGFVTREKPPDRFRQWVQGSTQRDSSNNSLGKSRNVIDRAKRNIWDLSDKDRGTLLKNLQQEIRERIIDGILDDFREDDGLAKEIRDVYDEVDRRALENTDVIGVTTSGLARRISVLRHIDCRVVICEEAGEVLEAHMLSALIPSVQHLIQIGDHQQLRPQIVNHKLSMESHSGDLYQLDRSQFERMALGEPGLPAFPTSQLNVQRRMRPEVSTLIRNTLYERLVDHESVKDLPNVVGMSKNVFWLDHENPEDAADQEFRGRSKSNTWEVQMTHALVRHIVRQGVYESKDIAVLTPYVGQLQKLRSVLQNDFEIVLSDRDQETLIKDGHEDRLLDSGYGRLQKKAMTDLLRIATVDNFQGEEAKVIIISLVRSNVENKVGFLKTSNRINVLLSRAKHGMYLVGNSKTYADVPMWSDVLGMLRMTDSIGPEISLRCDRHIETHAKVATPEDFETFSPQGGCREQCDQRLPRCGHKCRSKCHSDALHKAFKCPLPCARLFPCKHDCPKLCGEPCGLCMVECHNTELPCGHVKDKLPCHEAQDPKSVKCDVMVQKSVPSCEHVVTVPCFVDVTSEVFQCSAPCMELLSCGHKCPGTCHSCAPLPKGEAGPKQARHQDCKVICGRKHATCNHTCPRLCHSGSDCGVCQAKCEVRCAHSKCPKRCHEACPPCVERCMWGCEHQGQCSLPCAAPCNRLPCSKRCTKNLRCGHQCPSVCGERCPKNYCQHCSGKGDARVDMLEFKLYSEIDLDETPIVVLGCGHFFTAETLDGHIGMQDAYQTDELGEYIGLAKSTSLSQFVPRCPDCQIPIQQHATQRYNRVINQAVLDETSKRFIVSGNQALGEFDREIQELEAEYRKIKEMSTIRPTSHSKKGLGTSTQRSIGLTKRIETFIAQVSYKEQPVRKLHDATVKAMRTAPVDAQLTGLSINIHSTDLSPDERIVTGGKAKLLKLQYTVLDNLLQLTQTHQSLPGETINGVKEVLNSMETFIADPVSRMFPRMLVEVQLYYAKIAVLLRSHRGVPGMETTTTTYGEKAKEYLQEAESLCGRGFQSGTELMSVTKQLVKLLGEKWYEELTSQELAAIKLAMVSGRGGLSTHSGHWYNCENGHPFAVGECGMPMELARCPECGAQVGGQHHQPAEGVSRALDMER